jgi:DNA polymerase-3 subunit delta
MSGDLLPEDVLDQLEKGQLSPIYLFYGKSEFRLEKVINSIRETFIPEEARDLNLQIFYGDDTGISPGDITDTARSFPFMCQNRLIIVRRTESFPGLALETFIPYLDEPVESTCLIFVSSKPDFRKKFYKKIRDLGRSVNFKKLYDNQVVPWIRKTAKDLGLNIEPQACAYLQQLVGNQLRDLDSQLEKIYLYYGKTTVGLEEVKKLAIYSRSYTIFELMEKVSYKRRAEAISVLNRFLEEEGKDSALGVLGMFVRQIRLLWQAKSVMERGGRTADLVRKLGVQSFVAKKIEQQSRHWSTDDLERGFQLLYQADGLLKSGSQGNLVLENVVLSLCV